MRALLLFSFFALCSSVRVYAATCGGNILCQCGDTVTRDYTMTSDLGPCPGHGLTLASGVTLDGQKHNILGAGGVTESYGIYLRNVTGATVKNVIVSGFLRGLRLRDATLNTIVGSEFSHNGKAGAHVGYGIDVAKGSRQNTIRGSLIHHNADEGIHVGSGSGANFFVNNQVFDNYRENIYLLDAHDNTFSDNQVRGGMISFYIKDSRFNVFRGNIVRDKLVLVRGDSHENRFLDTVFWGAGIHFQVYTKDPPYRSPHSNEVAGGSINNAAICLRFSSSWGNIVRDTILNNCTTELLANSDEAPSRSTSNMATGIAFSPGKVRLEGDSHFVMGWRLSVLVQDEQQRPLANAHVKVRNAVGDVVFALLSDEQGAIPPQDVMTLMKTGLAQIAYTPLFLETTKAGYQTHSRLLSLTTNSTAFVTLQADSILNNSPPVADAGGDRDVHLGETVIFDGSLSRDSDADSLSFSWTFGDGTPMQTGMTVNHIYHSPGTFIATLTVSDGLASRADNVAITVHVPSGGVNLHDTFDRIDTSTLGMNWEEVQGDLQVKEQKLSTSSGKGQHIAIASLLRGNTQDAAVDFTSFNINAWRRFGIILRYQDPLNYYLLYRQAGAASVVRIAKIVDGRETILGSVPTKNPKNGEVFRLSGQAVETQITLELAGEPLLTVSDATFANGSLGVFLAVGRASILEADNFAGTAYE